MHGGIQHGRTRESLSWLGSTSQASLTDTICTMLRSNPLGKSPLPRAEDCGRMQQAGKWQEEELQLIIINAAVHRRKSGCNLNASGIRCSAGGTKHPQQQAMLGRVPEA